MAKTLWSFGHSECNSFKAFNHISHLICYIFFLIVAVSSFIFFSNYFGVFLCEICEIFMLTSAVFSCCLKDSAFEKF